MERVGPFTAVVAIILVGFFGSEWLMHEQAPSAEVDRIAENAESADTMSGESIVRLTKEKVEAAAISTTLVALRPLQATKTVSAKIEYDSSRHLDLRAPVACVVTKCLVEPGQWVKKGDSLASLTSAEIGLARNELVKCEADLRLAALQHDWAKQTHANLTELLALLKQTPSINDVETQFEGKLLGDHRDDLVSAYSQYLLASNVASRTKTLQDNGIVSGRISEERTSRKEVTTANFKSLCEQAAFESQRDSQLASAELDAAQRAVEVCKDRLAVLVGPHGANRADGHRSEFQLTAPFEGRVEELAAVDASRFEAGESLMLLADTRKVWVAAQIHQRNWNALSLATGHTLRLTVPAMPDTEFAAKVRFVGATVSSATLSVPLVAELDNDQSLFRPGMFVWVDVPIELPREALAVPVAAVQRHEQQAFVFVETGADEYHRVDIETGVETADWVQVVGGLPVDARVVDHGAFYLKSELLLEEEE